ncbi:hypothetical protein CYLTODRAFT_355469 [Cylindrobasidium torrendii FP15055 ss-10]|uniref:Fucose-specific lectin n=1 Tax=Cylindrobasidium torrendii FP15055 ss-10 TaxID=1314674 RepID=A0A0D7B6S4_9AGAR|nr:hypothetical protein CYLTODRAFT_355469 [Cylindrobasidium torrendii FP15055 ss-10]
MLLRLTLTLGHLLFFLWPAVTQAAPGVSLSSNTVLDNSAIYFVSYDGLVNVNSFQLNGVLTYGSYQYAGWYAADKTVKLARRKTGATSWETLTLNHSLVAQDSHNVVTLGVSPADGRIHVAMDCHSTRLYYTVSAASAAGTAVGWSASLFGSITNTIGSLNIGTVITYPQFVVTPSNLLQFVYRTGVSGNGDYQLAEYNNGTWTSVGQWAKKEGSYTQNGGTSSARSLYIHGFTYRDGRAHVTGTWRENSGSVTCNSGGLTNHDTVYIYSDDAGRAWKNAAGTTVSKPISVTTSGIIVDSLNPDHGLMNQESQDVDSNGRIHALISYVPGRFKQCVTSYQSDRTAYGHAFHVYQASNGTFVKVEIPFDIGSVGRSQIALDANDNAYVVLPFGRIVTASASSGWTDWTMAFNGSSQGLNAFGEVTVDRPGLVASGRKNLGVLYQEKSSNGASSPIHVAQFTLGG